jgi:hypothetical protein
MKAGTSVLPPRSTTFVGCPLCAFSISALAPSARIFPSLTASASAEGRASSTVTTSPFV